jgi:hypothetical protein
LLTVQHDIQISAIQYVEEQREVEGFILAMKNNKTTGYDGIPAEV